MCGFGQRTGNLVLSGTELGRDIVLRKLKEWLRLRVRDGLFPVAQKLAARHRLPMRGLLVKSQRTRWASCSAQKNLSLNTKLLFLSPDLVRYVLIHELCHTVHMNHSKEFWRLVASYEPSYKVLDQSLREAGSQSRSGRSRPQSSPPRCQMMRVWLFRREECRSRHRPRCKRVIVRSPQRGCQASVIVENIGRSGEI